MKDLQEEKIEKQIKITKKITKHFDFEKQKQKVKGKKIQVENYDIFKNPNNSKYNKLKKRTISLIQLDKELIKKSIKSILNFSQNEKQYIYLQIELNQQPLRFCQRPKQIELPFQIYDEKSKFCIFVNNVDKTKLLLKDQKIIGLNNIMDIKMLQKDYPKDSNKKQLCKKYDLFFCEIELYQSFQKNLGKVFYQMKKIPFPVDINQMNDLYKYSYFVQGAGPQYTVKIGQSKMEFQQLAKNVIHSIYNTVPYILLNSQKHTKINQIFVKTLTSICLPVYKNDQNQLLMDE